MSEAGEAPAAAEGAQPWEVTGPGRPERSLESAAAECYNARAVAELTGQGFREVTGHAESEPPRAAADDSGPQGQPKPSPDDQADASDRETPRSEEGAKPVAPQDPCPPEQKPLDPPTTEPESGARPPHRLKYDPQKEAEIARRKMMNPPYYLETDFKKYFDVRSGEGPKQPDDSDFKRGSRRWEELKARIRKLEQASSLIYNRKVRKRAPGGV